MSVLASYLIPANLLSITLELIKYCTMNIEQIYTGKYILWMMLSVRKSDGLLQLTSKRDYSTHYTYTRLYSLINILLIMPVSLATDERSFSAVKSHSGSTMDDRRLSNLSDAYTQTYHAQVDLDMIIYDVFSRRNQRLDFS